MKLKYMLAAGMMAAMTTGCNESSFLDLKPQGALNEDLLNSKEGIELFNNFCLFSSARPKPGYDVGTDDQLDLW